MASARTRKRHARHADKQPCYGRMRRRLLGTSLDSEVELPGPKTYMTPQVQSCPSGLMRASRTDGGDTSDLILSNSPKFRTSGLGCYAVGKLTLFERLRRRCCSSYTWFSFDGRGRGEVRTYSTNCVSDSKAKVRKLGMTD
jgi:hypothetical protein